ncbi:MAG: S8 family peptidase [Roseburia sp.]|nr:S8 family peptidase [Roseburia sp.]
MNCQDAVYSNDYYDILVSSVDVVKGGEELCRQKVADYYTVYYVNSADVPPLTIANYYHSSIPKLYTTLDQRSLEESGIIRVQNQRNFELRGRGILIGFVDTGITYTNSAFRNLDGSSRIVAIWDQTRPSETPPYEFIYGTQYLKSDIDYALQQENPLDFVPQVDDNGHGTMLASIAAGSEDLQKDFIGAAPYADIAMVKLKPAKENLREFYYIREGAVAYQENDILAGIDYISRLAEERQQPLVLCIGLGNNQGDHGEGGRLASVLDAMSVRRRHAICVAVGNEANARHHYYGALSPNTSETVEMNVTKNMRGFQMELWANAPEVYALSIISPTGEVLPKVPVYANQQQRLSFLLENTTVIVNYQTGGLRSRNQLIHIEFQNPAPGIWKLEVFPSIIYSGNFHIYLPMTDFLEEEVFFLRSNPDTTLTIPSGAASPISVAGYNAYTDGAYLDSGRGYSLEGTINPDFAAPAVNVYAQNQRGDYVTMTGTSAAAAIASGAAALLLEWNINYMNNPTVNAIEIKNQLINGTRQLPNELYPNRMEGYGRLDLYQTLLRMRNV